MNEFLFCITKKLSGLKNSSSDYLFRKLIVPFLTLLFYSVELAITRCLMQWAIYYVDTYSVKCAYTPLVSDKFFNGKNVDNIVNSALFRSKFLQLFKFDKI